MQIPLADLFAQRIASAIDAIETLSIGIMRAVPGAIGEGSGARLTGGVPGLLRLCRASASARWLSNVFAAMGDDVVSSLPSKCLRESSLTHFTFNG